MKFARGLAALLAVLLLASAAPPDSTQAPPKKSVPAGWGPPSAPASPHGAKKAPASPHGTKPGAANPHGAKGTPASPHGANPADGSATPPPPRAGEAPPPPAADAHEPADGQPLKPKVFTLGVRHRVAHEYAEKVEVKLREEFKLGDGEYSARILEFVPDFMINENRKVVSRSRAPRNPAIRIAVREKGAPRDTSWAFLNFAPHFSAKSVLAFQLLKIEFENHPPVEAKRDTAAARRGTP